MYNEQEVMTVGEWIGVLFILGIPIINVIMYFIWAFGGNTNQNLKNFCRATLIIVGVGFLFALLFVSCMSY